jgi:hypothetical protein
VDTYVYGVMGAAAGERPSSPGIDEQPVEVVTRGELAAIVSDAPSLPVKANRRNLRAHSQVLSEAVAGTCVLPVRFGVVMPSRQAVEQELLGARADQLSAQLEAFAPYVEVDLRALCPEEDLLRSVLAERPDIRDLQESVRERSEEASYYDRIRLGELVAQAVSAKREAAADRIAAELEPLAAKEHHGEALHEQMLANLAFLVERDRLAEFDAAVERLGTELPDEVRLSYVGPLPPHNFVDLNAEPGAWA